MSADDGNAHTQLDLSPGVEAQQAISDGVMKRLFGKTPAAPRRFGRYHVRTLLGRGAMGAVYTAHDPDLDRDVALKVLHAELEADERASLVGEAKVMARLNHRHIVAVYDVGEHDGRIFVAMERVDGDTLREWQDQEQRSWREVAEAYRQAALGLAAAHDAGVVHRDFKPDNALISSNGDVRVADFGIARVGDGPRSRVDRSLSLRDAKELSDSDAIAVTHSLAGTPAYLAPESIRGQVAGPLADQFAFCVALHEALYGCRPFSGKTVSDLLIRITDDQRDDVPTGAVVPARLRAIVERGLHRDPQRRFGSMHALAQALATCLVPWRRRLVVPGAAAAVIGSVALGGWGYGELQRSRCEVEAERAHAVWSEETASLVSSTLQRGGASYAEETARRVVAHLDRWTDQWAQERHGACEARASDPWAERRAHCLDRRLSALRGLVEVLRVPDTKVTEHALASARALADPGDCRDDAYLRATGLLPPSDADATRVEAVRQALSRARALDRAGKFEQASAIVRAQLAEATRLDAPRLRAETKLAEGTVLVSASDYAPAWTALEEAFALAAKADASDIAAQACVRMARLSIASNKLREGRVWAKAASGFVDRLGASGPPHGAGRLMALALIETEIGNVDAALAYVTQAGSLVADKLDAAHPLALNLRSLEAKVRNERQEFGQSIVLLREVLSLIEATEGAGHPSALVPMSALVRNLATTGRLEEAEEAATQVLELRAAINGPDDPEYAGALTNLGLVRLRRGDEDGAADLLGRSVKISEAALGKDHPRTLTAVGNLAVIEERRGDLAAALAYHAQLVDALSVADPARPSHLATALLNRAATKHAAGRNTEALEDLQRTQSLLEATPGLDQTLLVQIEYYRTMACLHVNEDQLAAAAAERALALAEAKLVPSDFRWGPLLGIMPEALRRIGAHTKAKKAAQRALQWYAEHDPDNEDRAQPMFALARLEAVGGDIEAAKATAAKVKELGGDSVAAEDVEAWLATLGR